VIDLALKPLVEVCSLASFQSTPELDHRLFSEVLVALQKKFLCVPSAVMVTLLALLEYVSLVVGPAPQLLVVLHPVLLSS
jgi:hypothetical protein